MGFIHIYHWLFGKSGLFGSSYDEGKIRSFVLHPVLTLLRQHTHRPGRQGAVSTHPGVSHMPRVS